jgi:hypothetical protein
MIGDELGGVIGVIEFFGGSGHKYRLNGKR